MSGSLFYGFSDFVLDQHSDHFPVIMFNYEEKLFVKIHCLAGQVSKET